MKYKLLVSARGRNPHGGVGSALDAASWEICLTGSETGRVLYGRRVWNTKGAMLEIVLLCKKYSPCIFMSSAEGLVGSSSLEGFISSITTIYPNSDPAVHLSDQMSGGRA